jgi:hypothetical protein
LKDLTLMRQNHPIGFSMGKKLFNCFDGRLITKINECLFQLTVLNGLDVCGRRQKTPNLQINESGFPISRTGRQLTR